MKNYHSNVPENQVTSIKKIHTGKAISVHELSNKLKNVSSNMNKKFIVQGYIMGLVDSKPENVIKVLEGEKAHDFNHKVKKA